ncbi:MAG: hypothetical protein NC408_01480 [Candidatus Gastranaerophilales bacterium]|nr:hypothetical protein [Candidatus Gastranaerophilales bacterium]MCM1072210.1 hypothetical protein [Bacteroides sp.]
MANINLKVINSLDRSFSSFAQETMARRKPDRNYVISQLQHYQTQYNKNGLFKDFLVRLEAFALGMEDSNLLDIAGMVFSKLAKFPTTDEMKEQFLRGGLRIARKQGDPIHILARIVDLKKLYENNGDSRGRYKMLFPEERALTDIVENFPKAKGRFRTVSKEYSPLDKYRLQLARVKVDIAKKLRPHEAYSRLIEAREIFEDLRCSKELKFVDRMLSKC